MTFADMQSYVLFRLRQRGPNFGALPTNTATDYDPPTLVKIALNVAYNEFLSTTQDAWPATLTVLAATVANAQSVALAPVPANGTVLNPVALRVYAVNYIQNATTGGTPFVAAIKRGIPVVGTDQFRRITGNYEQRYGASAVWPVCFAQSFGSKTLQSYPALGVSGDQLELTICPDPLATDAFYGQSGYGGLVYPCALGGVMSAPADVPLIGQAFHMALVEHAVASLAQAADKGAQAQFSLGRWQSYIEEQLVAGSAYGEGAAEQQVMDGAFDSLYEL